MEKHSPIAPLPASTPGQILHLQRLSTEDGPGIRTTVFFKGCPLRCEWCHNPESFLPKVQIQWHAGRCLGCCTCLSACPNGYLALEEGGLKIDRQNCQGCAACADACPANAIEALGRRLTAAELLDELLKDRVYYEKSGGGVTLSGGEPTLQPDFAGALLRGLRAAGIATALDTCGLCVPQTFDLLLPFVDLILYDMKLFDPELHKRYTGQSNRLILDNLLYLRDMIRRQPQPAELWIRTPLIPGATTAGDNLLAIGRFIAAELEGFVTRWELCAFNNLGRDKYSRLDQRWAYASFPLMTAGELARCEQTARSSGVDPEIVVASGATRQPEI